MHFTTNSWTVALLALSSATVIEGFAPQPLMRTPSLRGKTSLPYVIETDTAQLPIPSPVLNDPTLLELPELSSIYDSSSFFLQPSLDDVRLSLLPTDKDDGTVNKFPLVVTPVASSSLEFLEAFLTHNKDWVSDQIRDYGAILFRGFEIDSAADVQDAILSFEPNLNNSYRGTSPRFAQEGTQYVFSAAEVPSHFPIAQHLEMSFLPAPPKRLFFSALKAPEAVGGETALADFRKVYQDLPRKLRNKLASKKLLYRRTHRKVGVDPAWTHDVAAMKSWGEVFGTNDKEEVEDIAKAENMPMRWEGKNKDVFVSEYISEPFQLHPETNDPVWFNHSQVFHWTSFPAELFFAFTKTREWRFLARAVAVGLKSIIQYGLLGKRMAMDVRFGDGTPISIWEMHQIRRAVHKNMVLNRWRKGDLVMIDNFSTSHGRQPTYDGGRKVVVSWSDPIEKDNRHE